ncbi:hypothetical protein RH728_004072 [Vibrio vulnificus]|nr:hypothetical protein [Vibrio vulnificus]EKA6052226.1 hypothetical protein [Vibrio vulnificus]ELB7645893.1 hypothetical protein [Vibrio vulnificus]
MTYIKSRLIESFFPIVLVFGFAIPIAKGGFILSYVYGLFLFFLVIYLSQKIIFRNYSIIFAVSIIILMFLSSFIDSLYSGSYWFLRDFIRFPFYLLFLSGFSFNSRVFSRNICTVLTLLVFVDFVVLFVMAGTPLASIVLKYIAMSGMTDYLEGYWRHIGVGGNPNFSSFIYAIHAIVCIEVLRLQKSSLTKFISFFYMLGLVVSLFLLVLTFSRTSLLAFVVAAILMYFRFKYLPYVAFVILAVVVYLIFAPDFADKLSSRLTSFSSFQNRIDMWIELYTYYDFKAMLLGSALPIHINVVDNDYWFFIFRFGIPVSFLILVSPWVLWFSCRNKDGSKTVLGLLVFYYVAAFPGGTLTHPKSFIFLVMFLALICNNGLKNKHE